MLGSHRAFWHGIGPAWALWRKPRFFVCAAFVAYLLVGLRVYNDYGLSYDENTNRTNGAVSAIYVNAKLGHPFLSPEALEAKLRRIRGDDDLYEGTGGQRFDPTYDDHTLSRYESRHYGVFFELPLIAMEALLKLEDSRDVYLMRHLCTFLFFSVGVGCFYLLMAKRFRSRAFSVLGAAFLVMTPPIFAHAFYNSKDIAFLSLGLMATYSLIRFLKTPSVPNGLFHAATCAAFIDVRVFGLVMPLVTGIFITLEAVAGLRDRMTLKHFWPGVLAYVAALPLLVIAWWPYLWEDPMGHLLEAWATMSRFPWQGSVWYLGKHVSAASLPWHYLPVWMVVTIPPLYLACFAVGLYSCGRLLRKNGWRLYANEDERQDTIQLVLFCVPVIAVLVLRPVMLDGWRHLFFIYPAFLAIALKGLTVLKQHIESLRSPRVRALGNVGLATAVAAGLINTGWFMVKHHPHQQVYLNIFAGNDVRRMFELDYWGLSYRQALEYVLRQDASDVVKIAVANFPGELNARILAPRERQRLRYVPLQNADYFLSNFRDHPQDYDLGSEIHAIVVGGNKIMAVYKLRGGMTS